MKSYYITFNVVGCIDIFTRKEYSFAFMNTLKHWQRKMEMKLYAYVIMSNRVHLVIDLPETELDGFMKDFKVYSSTKIIEQIVKNENEGRSEWLMHMISYFGKYSKENSNCQFWQNDDQIIELTGKEQILSKIEFLHQRPVVHGLVFLPEHYVYSSANPFNQMQLISPRESLAELKKISFSQLS
jgi:REP element-mobilizing transposase RayT